MTTQTQTDPNYKTKVSFVDKKRNKVTVELELKDGRFSISGDHGGSLGQIVDRITPATDAQKRLVAIWNEWHLNDMHAGTPEQQAFLRAKRADGYNNLGFEDCCALLKEAGLYEVQHEGKPYTYGSAWLKRELPANFRDQLQMIVEALRGEASQAEKLCGSDDHIKLLMDELSLDEDGAELAIALGIMFDLTVDDIGDIDVSDRPHVTVQGIDYTAGDNNEMDKVVTDQIREELWAFNASFLASYTGLPEEMFKAVQDKCEGGNDAVLKCIEQADGGLEGFVEKAITADGRAHFLNSHDGTEESAEVNGTTYYAYRQ